MKPNQTLGLSLLKHGLPPTGDDRPAAWQSRQDGGQHDDIIYFFQAGRARCVDGIYSCDRLQREAVTQLQKGIYNRYLETNVKKESKILSTKLV